MQPSFCSGVQPGLSVVSFLRMIAGRLAARSTAWYSSSPEVEEAALLAAGDGRFARRRLAVGADHVRLPVVEVQQRGLADLRLRAPGVAHVRQRHVDFVRARALDFRLGDAQLVDALAHDVDRAVPAIRRPLSLRRRPALVCELDAALQVQAETRFLRLHDAGDADDHEQRQDHQPEDDQQDEGVAAAVGHRRSSASQDLLVGRQHEQQPAVVVIGRKHVRLRARRHDRARRRPRPACRAPSPPTRAPSRPDRRHFESSAPAPAPRAGRSPPPPRGP